MTEKHIIIILVLIILIQSVLLLTVGLTKCNENIDKFVAKLKTFWPPFMIYVVATGTILIFVAAFIEDKSIALSDMNNWVGIILGLSSWMVGIISLILSFYNVDKMVEAQKNTLKDVNEVKDVVKASLEMGWKNENGKWRYYESGRYIQNDWRKSGNNMFFLGEDGYMKENSLIKQGKDMYYVNKNGAMVTNDIKTVDGKVVYFGADGKAVKEGIIQFKNETYNIKEYNATKINKE